MSTIISIVNQAIIRVGEGIVTQTQYTNRSTKAAYVMAELYDQAKQEVLKGYPWRIAQETVRIEPDELTEAEADAAFGITLAGASLYTGDTYKLVLKEAGIYYVAPIIKFSYRYSLPEDLVRVKMVTDISGSLIQYDIQGQYILSDDLFIYLHYTKDIDESLMDFNLTNLVSLRLAWMACSYLGASEQLSDIRSEFILSLRNSKNLDAQQDASRVFQSTDWLDQRLSTYQPPYEGLG